MKVSQEFAPVTVTLETPKEFKLFWEIIEDIYHNYDIKSPERKLLVDLSNMICNRDG